MNRYSYDIEKVMVDSEEDLLRYMNRMGESGYHYFKVELLETQDRTFANDQTAANGDIETLPQFEYTYKLWSARKEKS